MDWTHNYYSLMAGIGQSKGLAAVENAYQNALNDVQSAMQQQAFDPAGYLVGVDGAIPNTESTVLGNRRIGSPCASIAPASHVETVERLPRVIELESEDE